jgi:methylenetetrahydrofolate reductase (NADPH)
MESGLFGPGVQEVARDWRMQRLLNFSFELFPPRTPEATAKLPGVITQLAAMGPKYFSITHGAGGSDQDGTYETLLTVVKHCGVEAAPHLTCVGSTRAKIAEQLQRYRGAGVRRIVALRGDLPATAMTASAPGEFHYANELVSFIRETHGDYFTIEVAAYPEMHPQAVGPTADFENFKRKVEAGADAALTQLFYNADAYFYFVERCAKAGITIPVTPGIMPITNYASTMRFCSGCGADLPRWVRLRLEELQDDKVGLVEFGSEVVTRLCETLLGGGASGLHFYTINQAGPVRRIWERLER